jgi:protein-L-isoaspartate O-methyltransferase
MLETLVITVTLVLAALIVWDSVRIGAPPLPSSPAMQAAMLSLLPEAKHCVALEVGAGWGGLAVAMARSRPTWDVTAVEQARVPYAFCRLRQRLFGPSNLTVVYGNGLEALFENADVVTCYLLPETMLLLRDRLETTGRPGGVLVSAAFGMRGWAAEKTIRLEDLYRTEVFRYRLPA